MYRILLLGIVSMVSLALAGPNSQVRLHFDAVAETPAVDATGTCAVDSTIVTAVRITGASKLYGYQFYLNFDTASLTFVSAKRGNDANPNFLEKNDGSASFLARISIRDSTRILVANSLLGDDESQCVSDSGSLGLFTFKHKKADSTTISIDSTILNDCELTEDSAQGTSPGKIIPPPMIGIVRSRAVGPSFPKATIRNGVIAVSFKGTTAYELTVLNTLGKKMYSQKGYSEQCRIEQRAFAPTSGYSQLMIIRVCTAGNELVIPLVQ